MQHYLIASSISEIVPVHLDGKLLNTNSVFGRQRGWEGWELGLAVEHMPCRPIHVSGLGLITSIEGGWGNSTLTGRGGVGGAGNLLT